MVEKIKQKQSPKEQRKLDWISEKGASSFLTCLPLEKLRFHLTIQEFHDAMSLRYNMPIVGETLSNMHYHVRKVDICFTQTQPCSRLHCRGTGQSMLQHSDRTKPSFNQRAGSSENSISTRDFWASMDKAFFDDRVLNSQATSDSIQSIPQT
eukprot:sb/3473397/